MSTAIQTLTTTTIKVNNKNTAAVAIEDDKALWDSLLFDVLRKGNGWREAMSVSVTLSHAPVLVHDDTPLLVHCDAPNYDGQRHGYICCITLVLVGTDTFEASTIVLANDLTHRVMNSADSLGSNGMDDKHDEFLE